MRVQQLELKLKAAEAEIELLEMLLALCISPICENYQEGIIRAERYFRKIDKEIK